VKNRSLDPDRLASRLKHLVAELFRLDLANPDSIPNHAPLIGGSLGLDSLDATEFAMCLEEEFGITIRTKEDFQAFASIDSLVAFIRARVQAASPAHAPATSILQPSS
jgi:acyl carrier protein